MNMKRNKVFQRMTSLLLVFIMVLSVFPMQAFAVTPIKGPGSNSGSEATSTDAKGYSASDNLI